MSQSLPSFLHLKGLLRAVFRLGDPSKRPQFIILADCDDSEILDLTAEFAKGNSGTDSKTAFEVVALVLDATRLAEIRQKLSHIPHRIAIAKSLDPNSLAEALRGIAVEEKQSLFVSAHEPLLRSPFGWIVVHASSESKLLDQAAKGWFPKEGGCYSDVIHFETRPYRIRMAKVADLPVLVKLEELCWPKELGMPAETLQRRIETYPEGQLVLQADTGVQGVVYSQRIASIEPVYNLTADTVHQLHNPVGTYVQLLALNILPEKQAGELGGQLLEFCLQEASLTPGVSTVIGVTRCINYPGPAKISMEDYLKQEQLDPVPRMHVAHGAEIRGVVPNYRPKDTANFGYGVLVHYTLKDRVSKKELPAKGIRQERELELTPEFIATLVDSAIVALLSDESKASYSRSTPLMDLGLDSLQLLALRARLGEDLLIDLSPTFFFENGTADATIEYLVEKKINVFKNWLYEVQWRPKPLPKVPAFTPDRLWVILEEGDKLSILLKNTLVANYQYCVTVRPAPAFKRISDYAFEVDPSSPADFTRLLEELPHFSQLAGVIDLWKNEAHGPELSYVEIEGALQKTCESFIHLANALVSSSVPKSAKLWVIDTSIVSDGNTTSTLQTLLSTLCKVAREEYPNSQCSHLALDSSNNVEDNCIIICNELLVASLEPQIAWRDNKRHVARLVTSQTAMFKQPVFSEQATYLIAGGLRPVGLQVAHWYIEHGAKNIVLLDEIQATPLSNAEMSLLRALGANIHPFVADFGDTIQLKKLFAQIKDELPPLKGVVHAAGSVDDDLLMHITWDRFKNSNRLKIAGSWHLHQMTKTLELDHFVLFSTCLIDLSPGGKASSVVANAFLDALSHYRRNLGLPSLTINWGPWKQKKVLGQHLIDNRLSTRVKFLNADEALLVLENIFHTDKPQLMAAQIEWESIFRTTLEPNLLFEEIASQRLPSKEGKPQAAVNEPIAIIGMACRFPGGADSPEKFWRVFSDGIDTITEVPPDRWDIDAYYDPDKEAPGKMYTRYGGFMDHVDLFDPAFFAISPREAEDMDPQQRISLEVAWEALENAGIPPHTLKGSNTGVFMGICFNDYGQLINKSGDVDAVDGYYSTGNHYSVTPGRIAYSLGVEGPAIAIDTACSSSLVSLDIAIEKIHGGSCDLAIAGGVNLILVPEPTINFCKSGMLAKNGRCKTFDENADGYVRSEGCGIVILKRLSDALRDHNRIHAIIRSTAINQDGASAGLTVPNGHAQEAVITSALNKANLKGSDIHYVEAHGTGTALGDPIEMKAIVATYGKNRDSPLIIGSAKTNIGHTEAAAGIAGLIKCVLSLQHEELPANLHFHQLNPHIDLAGLPIHIAAKSADWLRSNHKRFAAVSSFGFSGTNSHAILEEAPENTRHEEDNKTCLFPISAKTPEALNEMTKRLSNYLKERRDLKLCDIAYTLQSGREQFKFRKIVAANTHDELREKLEKTNLPITDPGTKEIADTWLGGAKVDWMLALNSGAHQIVDLPTYPFQRQRYWSAAASHGQRIKHVDYSEVKSDETNLWDQLLESRRDQYLEVIKKSVRQTLIDILKLTNIPPDFETCDLFSLGIDSIMGIKFKNSLVEDLNKYITLPSTLIFDYPSIDKISVMLTENVLRVVELENKQLTMLPLKMISQSNNQHFKLSSAQKRMWFMYELNRDDTSYNISLFARIDGNVKLDLLQKSFNKIIERHAMLRTTYSYLDDNVVQTINPAQSIPLVEIDWRAFTDVDQQAKLASMKESMHAFDLENGPVLKPSIIWLAESHKAILYLEIHHIACDGASFERIFEEWLLIYDGLLSDTVPNLPHMKAEYVDYANWLLEEQNSLEYKNALKYWEEQLQTAPRLIQLPTDFPRQQTDSYKGASLSFDVDPSLRQKIEKFARAYDTTPFAVLLTVYALILHKYSRDVELNIGLPYSRRPLAETENMVGFFINTLVTRHKFEEDKSFTALLKKTSHLIRDAFANQAASFEEVVDCLNIERNMSVHPLFQVYFNLLPGLFKHWKTSQVELEILGANSGYPEFDLSLEMFETESSYYSAMKYNSKIFTEDTVSGILQHFLKLLNDVIGNPTLKLSEMSLLTYKERTLMIESWNTTEKKYPLEKRMIDLFEENVAKYPDKRAGIYDDVALTYDMLNRKANQLAQRLIKLNVKPDQLIGVCLPRSLDMLIAVLAIMKSGAAYMPLDPAFPRHRLAYMVENSSCQCLITMNDLSALFPEYHGETICVDVDKELLSTEIDIDPGQRSTSENLAYVIYTSGSTGNPKGVQIEQGALSNFLLSMQEQPGLKESDVLLAVTTLSFDIAGLELFLPLMTGACVVIAPEEAKQDVMALQELINKHQITIMQATPTTWTMLFESGWQGDKALTVLVGGEALKLDLAQKLTRTCHSLWNMYGPTETTIWSSVSEIREGDTVITIGRPIANTTFYILDPYLHPTPLGVPGQLFIGGLGVARGYLNRDELTQEKFITDPFAERSAARIYNTGDLARYLPDGRVECLGRSDYQVKIRGFRLELGDVEAQLNLLPAVNNSVVIVREDLSLSDKQDKRLVAYIIPEDKDETLFTDMDRQKLFFGEIRKSLKNELPEYMIPSAFVLMKEFPLTPNRKIDRKILPKPSITENMEKLATSRVSNEVEKSLLEIWQQMIGSAEIGVDDNFFDSGGNSLLAVQVYKRINDKYPDKIRLVDIFSYPTIRFLAQYIEPTVQAESAAMNKVKERALRYRNKLKEGK
jgi:amino acid adenylation domain-containing protein